MSELLSYTALVTLSTIMTGFTAPYSHFVEAITFILVVPTAMGFSIMIIQRKFPHIFDRCVQRATGEAAGTGGGVMMKSKNKGKGIGGLDAASSSIDDSTDITADSIELHETRDTRSLTINPLHESNLMQSNNIPSDSESM